MSLTIPTTGCGGAILSGTSAGRPYASRHVITLPTRTALHVARAKKFSPRTGRNRHEGSTTTEDQDFADRTAEIERSDGAVSAVDEIDDGYFLPELPGLEPDFWEGEQFDGLGFFVEYLWAFGVLFALIACGVAVATYNEGATDFKDTPAYKESIQTQDFLEDSESATPEIFDSNPTEDAPSLE